jgi:hypothetical protein
LLQLAPAMMALRTGEVAAYHGAEHVSIGTYEHGEARPKEHERRGSHLVGLMLVTRRLRACQRTGARALPVGGARAGFGRCRRGVDGDSRG